jgi:hypothetical protein
MDSQSDQRPQKLYMYDYCPSGCLPGEKRDFHVTLFSDNTLLWYDVRDRCERIGAEVALLSDIFGRGDTAASAEERPFVIKTQANVGVITMVDRLKTIEDAKKLLSARTVEPLNRHLDAIFWPQVNPKLPEPLRKKEVSRKKAA